MPATRDQIHTALRRLARSTPPQERYQRFFNVAGVNESELDTKTTHTDRWMTAAVLLEEILQCQVPLWIDVLLHDTYQAQGHHNVHHQTTQLSWRDSLTQLGYPTTWLDQAQANSDNRWQTHWAMVWTLLQTRIAWQWCDWLQDNHGERVSPEIQRWQKIHQQLSGCPAFETTSLNDIFTTLLPVICQTQHTPPARWPRPHWATIAVEGMSERQLIPAVLDALGLNEPGMMVVDTGGKGPMVNWVTAHRQHFAGPLLVLLDGDGQPEAEKIQPHLSEYDTLVCLPGTLEDTYPDKLICQVINQIYCPVEALSERGLQAFRKKHLLPGSDNLALFKALWQFYELTPPDKPGPFEKVAFATHVAEQLRQPSDVPKPLVECLSAFAKHVTTYRGNVLEGVLA